jgi:hypothetical protein
MSDEHVIKHSLKSLATSGAYSRHDTAYLDPETGEGRIHKWSDRNKSGYDATVRVCRDCNTKILNNRIEKPFEKNLEAMAKGSAVALDSDAVTSMATWAAKTVMTRELLDRGRGDLTIPEWQYRWLHDYVSPPKTMLMYFGRAPYTPNKWDRHRRFRAVVERMSRVSWNLGGGPVSVRLRSFRHCA